MSGDSEGKRDRREGERRGDERRTFRSEEGRRDPDQNRRRTLKRFVLPVLLLTVPIVLLFAWRTAFVAPRRAAQVRAADAAARIAPILDRTPLPMVALRGSPDPAPAPPEDPLPELSPRDRAVLQAVERELGPSLRAAPTVAAVPGQLAVVHFLQGRELKARRSWESELARARGGGLADARVGLAVVAIRAGLRAEDEADRTFAWNEALRHLDLVPAEASREPAVLIDRAVALQLLGRSEEAAQVAASLPEASRAALQAWMEPPEP